MLGTFFGRVLMMCSLEHIRKESVEALKRFAAIVGFYELICRIVKCLLPEVARWCVEHVCSGKNVFFCVIVFALIYAVIKFLPTCKAIGVIAGSNIRIVILISQLLKQKGDLAISCNTTFDTSIENGFVKRKSLQYDFQKKFYPEVANLDSELEVALKAERPQSTLWKRKKSKQKNYSVGTVAHVPICAGSGRSAYLVAISTSSKTGGSTASFESVQNGMTGLWKKVVSCGPARILSVPVFGTGQAGVKESGMMIIKEIVRSFIAAADYGRVADELRICVHPKDWRRMQINFYDLRKFLDVQCARNVPIATVAPRGSVALDE